MSAYSPVSAEEFVRIWQSASSVREVSEKTGMKMKAIYVRSSTYRGLGIMLKHMPQRAPKLDITALNKLCK